MCSDNIFVYLFEVLIPKPNNIVYTVYVTVRLVYSDATYNIV